MAECSFRCMYDNRGKCQESGSECIREDCPDWMDCDSCALGDDCEVQQFKVLKYYNYKVHCIMDKSKNNIIAVDKVKKNNYNNSPVIDCRVWGAVLCFLYGVIVLQGGGLPTLEKEGRWCKWIHTKF